MKLLERVGYKLVRLGLRLSGSFIPTISKIDSEVFDCKNDRLLLYCDKPMSRAAVESIQAAWSEAYKGELDPQRILVLDSGMELGVLHASDVSFKVAGAPGGAGSMTPQGGGGGGRFIPDDKARIAHSDIPLPNNPEAYVGENEACG